MTEELRLYGTNLTQSQLLEAVRAWQRNPHGHPLTCRKDSRHGKLAPIIVDNRLVLICPGCDYWQEHVPATVAEAWELSREGK